MSLKAANAFLYHIRWMSAEDKEGIVVIERWLVITIGNVLWLHWLEQTDYVWHHLDNRMEIMNFNDSNGRQFLRFFEKLYLKGRIKKVNWSTNILIFNHWSKLLLITDLNLGWYFLTLSKMMSFENKVRRNEEGIMSSCNEEVGTCHISISKRFL